MHFLVLTTVIGENSTIRPGYTRLAYSMTQLSRYCDKWQVSLLFEVEDLAVASPATVSRAGMVYNDVVDLGWWPYVNSWLANKETKLLVTILTGLFDGDLPKILAFVMNNCNKIIPVSETNLVISLCHIFDGIYGGGNEVCLTRLS